MEPERQSRVEQLVEEALELEEKQRHEFLERHCAGDKDLRREVESLLAFGKDAENFMEASALEVAAQRLAMAHATPERRGDADGHALEGQVISHYRVLSKLGSGGMGVVYEAEDLRLGRHVALKLLLDSQASDNKVLLRFQQEARAIASLNHPHICTLYEVEEHEGKPVIVMELLVGETLKAGRVALPQVLRWGTEVADALEAAHAAGLIHRDIKPANIFITSRGSAKVLDFGLAKTRLAAPGTASPIFDEEPLTSLGVIPGTTPYMSPEQVRGEELDGRTDVFSLGAVLYEMATGHRAFREKSPVLIMDAVLNKRPAPLTQVNPELPKELEQIIDKALEKDRSLRYQSAADLRNDLAQLKDDTDGGQMNASRSVVLAVPVAEGAVTDRLKWWYIVAPAALLVAVVAGGLYYHAYQARLLSGRETVVLAEFNNSTGNPIFDGTLRQGLSAQLEQSPFLNLLSDERIAQTLSLMTQPKTARLTHQLAMEICQRTSSMATIEGSIASLGSQYVLGLKAMNCRDGDLLAEEQVTADRKEQVIKALDNAATKLRKKLGESTASLQKYDVPVEKVTTPSLEALNAYSLGRKALQEKGDLEAIPFYQRAIQLDSNFAMAYLSLGIRYWNIGEAKQAKQYLQKAFALRDRVSTRESFAIASQYYGVAQGDLQKAREVYLLWAQTYPQDLVPLDALGNDYLFLGRYPEALEVLLQEEKLAHDGNFNYVNLYLAYLGLNRLPEARRVIEEGLARKLNPLAGHASLYAIDFLEGNVPGMQANAAWALGKPFGEGVLEGVFFNLQSDTETYWGHRAQARILSGKAVAAALRDKDNEIAAKFTVYAALREAELGDSARAVEDANSALTLLPSKDVKTLVALALARAGSAKRSQVLADELARANPSDTVLNLYWLPTIRAASDLEMDRPAPAIATLQVTEPYELGQPSEIGPATLYPVYVRGQAYWRLGQASQAAAEFQKVLDHPGCVMNFPLGALAHLGVARANALQAKTTQGADADAARVRALAGYKHFLAIWKDADPDVPILREARAEYAKLQ